MARKRVNTMVKTPDGVFNAQQASAVTPTDKGVAVVNNSGQLMCWIEVRDPDLRRQVSNEVSERVCQAQIGENIEPIDWEAYGLSVEGKPTQPPAATKSVAEVKSN
ncbi:hypothetical protein GCM10009104_23790 [Marinobacterium maritimum]|uniref:Uncharacterized protein n=1 Tax=Marinobacterium maritimum TaxID=500162 RepID=A0ABN1I7L2_9GAMM